MKFKVGDKIACYANNLSVYGSRGTVIKVCDGKYLSVKMDNRGLGITIFHPKQCRRLKPKQKPVAREWWAAFYRDCNPMLYATERELDHEHKLCANYVGKCRVREVLQNPTSNEVGG